MHVSAVIFDMDGLMFDTEQIAQIAWRRAAADLGYEFSEDVFFSVIGRNLPDVERITRQVFGNDFPFQEAYRRKQTYVKTLVEQNGIPFKPGLLELLAWIDGEAAGKPARLRKAVASSSTQEIIRRNLQLAGLEVERFDALVGGDEVQHGKPAPDIFLLASRRLDVAAGECLVLEDSNAGIRAVHAAGMVAVMIPDIIPPDEVSKALAYRILPSLHCVKELIRS
jgi:beta-phosphoglucomutase-like phosphatase (HAD superfamily)